MDHRATPAGAGRGTDGCEGLTSDGSQENSRGRDDVMVMYSTCTVVQWSAGEGMCRGSDQMVLSGRPACGVRGSDQGVSNEQYLHQLSA